jgi:hypothetical protein
MSATQATASIAITCHFDPFHAADVGFAGVGSLTLSEKPTRR